MKKFFTACFFLTLLFSLTIEANNSNANIEQSGEMPPVEDIILCSKHNDADIYYINSVASVCFYTYPIEALGNIDINFSNPDIVSYDFDGQFDTFITDPSGGQIPICLPALQLYFKKAGTTVLTISAKNDPSIKKSITFNVQDAVIPTIIIQDQSDKVYNVGDCFYANYVVLPIEEFSNVKVTSTDENILSVGYDGQYDTYIPDPSGAQIPISLPALKVECKAPGTAFVQYTSTVIPYLSSQICVTVLGTDAVKDITNDISTQEQWFDVFGRKVDSHAKGLLINLKGKKIIRK